jgi:type I restriction enzyme S subunit
MQKFQRFINPIFRQIRNLQRKSEILRRTRDLLLPRLVSGALDVSNLNIAGGGTRDEPQTEKPAPGENYA